MSAPLFAVVVRRMTWDIAHCSGRSPRRFVARIARNSHFTPSGRLVLRIIFSWQSVTPDRDQFQGIPGVPVLRQMLRPIAWAESGSFWRAGQGQGDELISIALGSRSGLFTPACVRVKTDTSLFYCLCSATQSRFSARITVVSSRAQTFPASLLLFPQPSSLFSILHVQSILFVAVVLVFSHSLFFFFHTTRSENHVGSLFFSWHKDRAAAETTRIARELRHRPTTSSLLPPGYSLLCRFFCFGQYLRGFWGYWEKIQ